MSALMASRTGHHTVVASADSHRPDPSAAVAEIAAVLGTEADMYAVFVAPGYDLAPVGAALKHHFGDRVIGCTSSGNIGPRGYDRSGICAVAFTGGLHARTITVGPLDDAPGAVERAAADLADLHAEVGDRESFAILLTDGLTRNEDLLAANLMAALGDVPIIGASAGDDLTFRHTAVYHDGDFTASLATVTIVCTDAPFRLIRLQHHETTDTILVATDVDPDLRIIRAFNGRPAAQEYAQAVGTQVAALNPTIYSKHPLLLNAGGSSWVRSIAATNPDGTLSMLARVDIGDVLRVGRPIGMFDKLEHQFAAVEADLGPISGMLAFDCILRRLEFEEHRIADRVGGFLAEHGTVGFSTYGEQFNGMHMNQTLVAVAFA
ncbi:FIST N-terminal domain-containing protein [Actinoplanes solisilvae]|uniref:FIST N-terminal domain-containing protein n=1 Tax=Actinoplanes solisilvae TaxID=2486853 RepID=UPI0013E3683E|nr:FIST N-terminal domain-containing protein [Actinoplanes solisilvae]